MSLFFQVVFPVAYTYGTLISIWPSTVNKMFVTKSKAVEPALVLSRNNFLMDPRAPNQTKALRI